MPQLLAVVLLHAFPLSSSMWDDTRSAMGGRCRLLTPDLRGFGGAPPYDGEPSLARLADDVVALLDREGIEQAVLGGCSMGGYVTMAVARRAPERVRALALVDTKAGADPQPARDKRLRMADRLEVEGSVDALVEEVLPGLLGPTTKQHRPQVTATVEQAVRGASAAGAAWAQRAMAARPDSVADLQRLGVPALVVRGAEDELSSRADADQLVAALSREPSAEPVQLAELAGAGHLPPLEVPTDFSRTLVDFLATLPGAGRRGS